MQTHRQLFAFAAQLSGFLKLYHIWIVMILPEAERKSTRCSIKFKFPKAACNYFYKTEIIVLPFFPPLHNLKLQQGEYK